MKQTSQSEAAPPLRERLRTWLTKTPRKSRIVILVLSWLLVLSVAAMLYIIFRKHDGSPVLPALGTQSRSRRGPFRKHWWEFWRAERGKPRGRSQTPWERMSQQDPQDHVARRMQAREVSAPATEAPSADPDAHTEQDAADRAEPGVSELAAEDRDEEPAPPPPKAEPGPQPEQDAADQPESAVSYPGARGPDERSRPPAASGRQRRSLVALLLGPFIAIWGIIRWPFTRGRLQTESISADPREDGTARLRKEIKETIVPALNRQKKKIQQLETGTEQHERRIARIETKKSLGQLNQRVAELQQEVAGSRSLLEVLLEVLLTDPRIGACLVDHPAILRLSPRARRLSGELCQRHSDFIRTLDEARQRVANELCRELSALALQVQFLIKRTAPQKQKLEHLEAYLETADKLALRHPELRKLILNTAEDVTEKRRELQELAHKPKSLRDRAKRANTELPESPIESTDRSQCLAGFQEEMQGPEPEAIVDAFQAYLDRLHREYGEQLQEAKRQIVARERLPDPDGRDPVEGLRRGPVQRTLVQIDNMRAEHGADPDVREAARGIVAWLADWAGYELICPDEGEEYNPYLHEAVGTMAGCGAPAGAVAKLERVGLQLPDGRVIAKAFVLTAL